VQISLLVKQFSVWVFSSVYIQIVVVYLAFSFQLRAVYRLGFSVDTGDRSEQGTHMFWEQPNGSGTGSTSSLLPHWEDSIPIGANVITC
jgi:hypothetical protein